MKYVFFIALSFLACYTSYSLGEKGGIQKAQNRFMYTLVNHVCETGGIDGDTPFRNTCMGKVTISIVGSDDVHTTGVSIAGKKLFEF